MPLDNLNQTHDDCYHRHNIISKPIFIIVRDSIYIINNETKEKELFIDASNNKYGYQDGDQKDAMFWCPSSLVLSSDFRTLYISDKYNHCIRVVDIGTRSVSTLVGHPTRIGFENGDFQAVCFNTPSSLAISPDDSYLYVADSGNRAIRCIDLRNKTVSTLLEHDIENLENNLESLTISNDGKQLYLCNAVNNSIFKISILEKSMSRLVGGKQGFQNGSKDIASFNYPLNVTISNDGKYLYVLDTLNHCVRSIDLITGQVDTFINGFNFFENGFNLSPCDYKQLKFPSSLTFSQDEQTAYIVDKYGGSIRCTSL